MDSSFSTEADVFKAFCNEHRLRIIERLRTGEKCACDLQVHIGISQPNLSHHMKVLCASGVVVSRQEGKWTHYSLSPEGSKRAMKLLEEVLFDVSAAE